MHACAVLRAAIYLNKAAVFQTRSIVTWIVVHSGIGTFICTEVIMKAAIWLSSLRIMYGAG